MKKRIITAAAAVLILALGVGIGVYAASNYGTQADPLVAKSYLDDVLTPKLKSDFTNQLNTEMAALDNRISGIADNAKGNYTPVTLADGQGITASAGCEIILRGGSVSALGAMSDLTSGTSIAPGDVLAENHLCVTAANSSGVFASGSATLLVRGAYSIA